MLSDVRDVRDKMADRSGERKKVPDTVCVIQFFSHVENIKNHPGGMRQTAGCQPVKPWCGKGSFKASEVKRAGPSHPQIAISADAQEEGGHGKDKTI